MRKLKLQMQTTVDGFVAGLNGEADWMSFEADDELAAFMNALTDSCDTILMGRKMTEGFVSYWTSVAEKPESPDYAVARKMVDYPKIVFTKTLNESLWANTNLAKGDVVEEVTRLKNQPGKDIIVYGGANFVRSLIGENLIDEYNFFVNPVAIGKGMTIFNRLNQNLNLKLVESKTFKREVVLRYQPSKGE